MTPTPGSATPPCPDCTCVPYRGRDKHDGGCPQLLWSLKHEPGPAAPPSATPEGKPTAREVACAEVRCRDSDQLKPDEHWHSCDELTRILEADRARRDALHAETLEAVERERDEIDQEQELVLKNLDASMTEASRLRAALQHGEERERVLREALERIAEYEIDWREGPGYNIGVLQQRAEDALATAQAMKEGSGE